FVPVVGRPTEVAIYPVFIPLYVRSRLLMLVRHAQRMPEFVQDYEVIFLLRRSRRKPTVVHGRLVGEEIFFDKRIGSQSRPGTLMLKRNADIGIGVIAEIELQIGNLCPPQ